MCIGGRAHRAARGGGSVWQVGRGASTGLVLRQHQLPHLQHQQRPQRLSQIAAPSQTPLPMWRRLPHESRIMPVQTTSHAQLMHLLVIGMTDKWEWGSPCPLLWGAPLIQTSSSDIGVWLWQPGTAALCTRLTGRSAHLRRWASISDAWPHTKSLSSACGASKRTFSQPGTAAATPFLKFAPLTTAQVVYQLEEMHIHANRLLCVPLHYSGVWLGSVFSPGKGTESMLGNSGSKSEKSSGRHDGRCWTPGVEPQCACEECTASANACQSCTQTYCQLTARRACPCFQLRRWCKISTVGTHDKDIPLGWLHCCS